MGEAGGGQQAGEQRGGRRSQAIEERAAMAGGEQRRDGSRPPRRGGPPPTTLDDSQGLGVGQPLESDAIGEPWAPAQAAGGSGDRAAAADGHDPGPHHGQRDDNGAAVML